MNHLDPAIDVSGLAKQLSGHDVLRDVTFTLMRQEIVAVVGANGAGKTSAAASVSSRTNGNW